MKTLFIGQNRIHLQDALSTNSYANELLRQFNPVEGTIVYSFNQKEGRGQQGNIWESEANKNIALSLILYPKFLSIKNQFLLNKIASLAIADLMAELLGDSYQIKIKWPNDIYVNEKKIAGILIENVLRESQIQTSIIGFGININQTNFVSTNKATSLALLSNREYDKLNSILQFCEFFEARYLQLRADSNEIVDKEYLQKLYQLGEWKKYEADKVIFDGKISGVSKSGKLQVLVKSDEIMEFDTKEIQFL